MQKVCRDYASLFDEIEENPLCGLRWSVANHVAVGRPRYISLDRTHCEQQNVERSEVAASYDLSPPCASNCGNNRELLLMTRTSFQPNSLELSVNSDNPAMSVQLDSVRDVCQTSEIPSDLSVSVQRANSDRNEDITSDCVGRVDKDSETLAVGVALQENVPSQYSAAAGIYLYIYSLYFAFVFFLFILNIMESV